MDTRDPHAPADRELLQRAADEWRDALIDVGGTNRLLHFRSTAATVDLAQAAPDAYTALLAGGAVRLSQLFPGADAHAAAHRACTQLHRRQREAVEEYGVPVTHLAVGFATWLGESDAAPRPHAPVLLRPLQIERTRGAGEGWTLTLTDDVQVNTVLLHVLAHAGAEIAEEDLLAPLEDLGPEQGMRVSLARLDALAADVEGFAVMQEAVLAAFSYQKQPMVADVTDLDALAGSELVRALAGEPDAMRGARTAATGVPVEPSSPDYAPVDSEYLVLDADASQSYVVNAALAGRNLVVQGPPGTGKSQTIANLIAALIASGKHVLFVAQKRAAITAVLDRLDHVGLSHLLLDLFAADGSRRLVAEQLKAALERPEEDTGPEDVALHSRLAAARDRLVAHKDALTEPRHGWGISVSALRTGTAGIPTAARTSFRLPASAFGDWAPGDLDRHAAALDELHELGALSPAWRTAPGWRPDALRTREDAQRLRGRVLELQQRLVGLTDLMPPLARAAGYPAPATLEQVAWVVGLHAGAARLERRVPGLVHAPDVEELAAAVGGGEDVGFWRRRGLKRRARDVLEGVPREEHAALLAEAGHLRSQWRGSGAPSAAPATAEAEAALAEVRALLGELAPAVQGMDLEGLGLEELQKRLARLTDGGRASALVRSADARAALAAAGLDPFVRMLVTRLSSGEPLDAEPGLLLRWAVLRSLLEEAELSSPGLAGLRGADLDRAARAYRTADVAHLAANATRVRRRAAEHLEREIDAHGEEYARLVTEITRKRTVRPVRQLFEDSPHVMRAATPVWAMSPLQVSRLLPAERCFDVVVFDEASQIRPADAVPALLRAGQAVVAGDSRQLPPTEFFTKVMEDASEDEDDAVALDGRGSEGRRDARPRAGSLTKDAESILAAMDRLLAGQSRGLQWHYRSRDERLIAVSNEHVYHRSLTTFPAADAQDAVRHVEVPASPGINGSANSPEVEVAAVVELVREHVRRHPGESLGIIAFGAKHEARIEAALFQAMAEDPAFERALNARTDEPWFVKAIERVQGDERDAVILSVGYGKGADGRLRYFWGPLLREGGERRLNVAISRAKRRMTLVTSFSPDDVPADGHSSAGFQLMHRFLHFMASGGTRLTGGPSGGIALNPFELDVQRRLEEAGLSLDAQVGVGGYRIDFAARHPEKPGRHVLAIEADGASYHSGHTARERDRLRQSMLEARGWRFHRIWSTDWFADADAEVAKTVAAFEAAVAADDAG